MMKRPRAFLFKAILIGLLTGFGGVACSQIDGKSYSTNTEGDEDTSWDDECTGGTSVEEECYQDYEAVTAEPAGVSPDSASICEEPEALPVISTTSARVTLNAYSVSPTLATGHIDVPAEIVENMVKPPTIEIIYASDPVFEDMIVSDLEPATGGFTFNASWSTIDWPSPEYPVVEIVVRVTIEIQCDPDTSADGGMPDAGETDAGLPADPTRVVTADTHLNYCFVQPESGSWYGCSTANWVSSGDYCWQTETFFNDPCEMAPTPIMPEPVDDGMALPGAIDAEVNLVARFDGTVVVIADHFGARGNVNYDWRVSGGELSTSDQGGVVWKMPSGAGPHLIQVAVSDSLSLGVAGKAFVHEA